MKTQQWTPYTNCGIRFAEEDELLDYSILGPMVGLKEIKISMKKGDPIIVICDYDIGNLRLPLYDNRKHVKNDPFFFDDMMVTQSNMDLGAAWRYGRCYVENWQEFNPKIAKIINVMPSNQLKSIRNFVEGLKKDYQWIHFVNGTYANGNEMLEIVRNHLKTN